MDFGRFIGRAFDVAWKYKSLWVFGLFAGGVGTSQFNFDNDHIKELVSWNLRDFGDIHDFPIDFAPEFIGFVLLWLAVIALFFFACHLISVPALIDGVNKITRGGVYRFASSFSRGLDFFWRYLGLILINIFIVICTIAVIVVFAIVLTPLSLLLTLPALLVIMFTTFHVFSLAEVAMVARNGYVGDALVEGWTLLKNNLGNCILMALLYLALGIGFAITLIILALMTFGPLNLVVYGITDSLLPGILLSLALGLPISLVLGGFTGTFFQAFYVQFYFGLVEPVPASAMPVEPSPGPAQPPNAGGY